MVHNAKLLKFLQRHTAEKDGHLIALTDRIRLRRFSFQLKLLSWVYVNGELPHGFGLVSTCGVSNCVKPEHLYTVTETYTIRDRWMTEWEAYCLIEDLARGIKRSHCLLKYSVTKSTVQKICNGLRHPDILRLWIKKFISKLQRRDVYPIEQSIWYELLYSLRPVGKSSYQLRDSK